MSDQEKIAVCRFLGWLEWKIENDFLPQAKFKDEVRVNIWRVLAILDDHQSIPTIKNNQRFPGTPGAA